MNTKVSGFTALMICALSVGIKMVSGNISTESQTQVWALTGLVGLEELLRLEPHGLAVLLQLEVTGLLPARWAHLQQVPPSQQELQVKVALHTWGRSSSSRVTLQHTRGLRLEPAFISAEASPRQETEVRPLQHARFPNTCSCDSARLALTGTADTQDRLLPRIFKLLWMLLWLHASLSCAMEPRGAGTRPRRVHQPSGRTSNVCVCVSERGRAEFQLSKFTFIAVSWLAQDGSNAKEKRKKKRRKRRRRRFETRVRLLPSYAVELKWFSWGNGFWPSVKPQTDSVVQLDGDDDRTQQLILTWIICAGCDTHCSHPDMWRCVTWLKGWNHYSVLQVNYEKTKQL